jgi:hypothetical protein
LFVLSNIQRPEPVGGFAPHLFSFRFISGISKKARSRKGAGLRLMAFENPLLYLDWDRCGVKPRRPEVLSQQASPVQMLCILRGEERDSHSEKSRSDFSGTYDGSTSGLFNNYQFYGFGDGLASE